MESTTKKEKHADIDISSKKDFFIYLDTGSKKIKLKINQKTKVSSAKKVGEDNTGVSFSKRILSTSILFGNKVMSNDKTIVSYGIKAGDTIYFNRS